jgi:hypothetical protein
VLLGSNLVDEADTDLVVVCGESPAVVKDTVLVPPTTIPAVPALASVPSMVAAEPPGDNVVPSRMISLPVPRGEKAVIVRLPKVKTACEAVGMSVDLVLAKGMVFVPSTSSPALPALTMALPIVTGEPPGVKVVPSMMIALPVPRGKKAAMVRLPKVKTTCEAVVVGAGSVWDKGIVWVPSNTSSAAPALRMVPPIVAAEPPRVKVVSPTTIADG